jgi:hypothetical protein
VAQCETKCRQAFSGCTKGEVRSTQRRDLIAASAPTQDHRRIAASGPAQDHRRNLVECLKEMGLTPDPGLQFEVTIGQDGTQIFFA